jgi:DNA-binding beta-propeller fold protein YncE
VVHTVQIGADPKLGGDGPTGVVITPDGQYAYVADQNSDTVSVIDTAKVLASTADPLAPDPSSVVHTVAAGDGPDGVAITPDGDHVYVTNKGSDTVSVINTDQVLANTADPLTPVAEAVTFAVKVGDQPIRVAITPDGGHAYVTQQGTSNSVAVINTTKVLEVPNYMPPTITHSPGTLDLLVPYGVAIGTVRK